MGRRHGRRQLGRGAVGICCAKLGEAEVFADKTARLDPGAWSKSVLSRAWIHSVLELGRGLPRARRLYWMLITSGFRTYRFLPDGSHVDAVTDLRARGLHE